jgi:hypothetical protein
MNVGIYGSIDWDNYPELMRQMTLFIQEAHELEHKKINLVHSGKKGAENMISEYVGKTEKFLRQKGFKLTETLYKSKEHISADVKIIESGIEYALLFSTKDKRTASSKEILKVYGIPYRVIEGA